ncbi:MAG: NADPH-dependent glutamate synthase [Thermoproteota archaeon]
MTSIFGRSKKRQQMPKRAVEERIRCFDEVALGYDVDQAIDEAKRCLQCRSPRCVEGCPVGVNIPKFINKIVEKNFSESIRIIKEKNNLPAISGRVCPQEDQCEKMCVLGKRGEPVAIGALERFVADLELKNGPSLPVLSKATGIKIAIVGSGPAGLTAAGDLAKLGHSVTIFEALHRPGGVLTYGIPEFRLPKAIVEAEIEYVKKLGAKIETNVVVGKTITLEEIFEMGYRAVFIATGAGSPNFMHIPGENLNNIYSANEFLTRTNLMKAYKFPIYETPIKVGKIVAVIGAGNVAMDAARTALRLGAREVFVIYRRSETEIPARREEVENAKQEGIRFQLLTLPISYASDSMGCVESIECVKMELGEPDETGRRRPIPIKGSNFKIEVDTVIVAIGQYPNPILTSSVSGLAVREDGTIITFDNYGKTSRDFVWAGGDIVTGEATVIDAMGAGKKAAEGIHLYVSSK